jgi:hypothetical protein
MSTAVSRGAYYKQKTARWLRAQGYATAFLERVLYIQGTHGLVPVKRDQLGSDVLAVNAERVLFVQVKSGPTWRSQLAAARQAFAPYPVPLCGEQVILGWPPRARQPEMIHVAIGPQRADHAVLIPPRRKPKSLPLFARLP